MSYILLDKELNQEIETAILKKQEFNLIREYEIFFFKKHQDDKYINDFLDRCSVLKKSKQDYKKLSFNLH